MRDSTGKETDLAAGGATEGLLANRPAAGTSGALYFATDVNGGTLYLDNGTSWAVASFPTGSAQFDAAAHAARHNSGGADAMAIDAAQATGSLRTVGGVPVAQAFGDAASAGTGTKAAATDHRHGMPVAKCVIGGGANLSIGFGTDVYATLPVLTYSGDETNIRSPLPLAGTLRNLYVRLAVNGMDGTLTATLFKNGVATALTVTVTAGSIAVFSDTTHSVAVAQGDLISMHLVTAGTGGSGYIRCVAMELDP